MTDRLSLEDSLAVINILEEQKRIILRSIEIAEKYEQFATNDRLMFSDELQERAEGLVIDLTTLMQS